MNPYIGLFFFDSRFRPVPLEQQFIGVKEVGSGGGAHLRQVSDISYLEHCLICKMVYSEGPM